MAIQLSTLTTRVKKLVLLREKKSALAGKVKEVNGKLKELEMSIASDMTEAGLSSVKIGKQAISIKIAHFPRVVNQEEFIAFCKKDGLFEDLYSLTVHFSTLRSWYTEWRDENKTAKDPTGLEVYHEPRISVRGLNKG